MELLDARRRRYVLLVLALAFVAISSFTECYDPLDPDGKITVTFDIFQWTTDGYLARVTIENLYLYRHIDRPGWQLGWSWPGNEVIWSMKGAFAVQQGNCSSFKEDQIPHSCRPDPVVVDLNPDAVAESQSENCCHSGILSARAIDPSKSSTSFEIKVGNLNGNFTANFPQNLTLLAPGPGYTCGSFMDEKPTVFPVIGGRREEQVFRTWKSTCTYSSFVASQAPTCCVSLSTFYNSAITECPRCSCGCKLADKSATSCVGENFVMQMATGTAGFPSYDNIVRCTDHMCPVRVHWHVKSNYDEHWRVKVTVSNYNYGKNYSDWNLVVQHPGLGATSSIYSFNSTMLPTTGFEDEVALFWGISNWNQMLLQTRDDHEGSVSTEILLPKKGDSFTFKNGWALPRRIYFNGENCQMPLPDEFPMLPNSGTRWSPKEQLVVSLLISFFMSFKALVW